MNNKHVREEVGVLRRSSSKAKARLYFIRGGWYHRVSSAAHTTAVGGAVATRLCNELDEPLTTTKRKMANDEKSLANSQRLRAE